MKRVMSIVILGLVLWGLAGCASTPQYQGTPSTQMASDNLVDIKVTLVLDERYGISVGYTGLILEVRNKTAQDITINWDETFYLQGGTPNGGFSLGGATGGQAPRVRCRLCPGNLCEDHLSNHPGRYLRYRNAYRTEIG